MPGDLLNSLLPYMGCIIRNTPDGLELTISTANHLNAAAVSNRTFRAPFTLTANAKTDSTNLRLYWHAGEIILNWECSIRQLRVHDPETGQQHGIEDQGFIAVNEWHEVVWEIKPTSMRLLVDGELRFQHDGHYAGIEAPVAIGPCFGSKVTVRRLDVQPGSPPA